MSTGTKGTGTKGTGTKGTGTKGTGTKGTGAKQRVLRFGDVAKVVRYSGGRISHAMQAKFWINFPHATGGQDQLIDELHQALTLVDVERVHRGMRPRVSRPQRQNIADVGACSDEPGRRNRVQERVFCEGCERWIYLAADETCVACAARAFKRISAGVPASGQQQQPKNRLRSPAQQMAR